MTFLNPNETETSDFDPLATSFPVPLPSAHSTSSSLSPHPLEDLTFSDNATTALDSPSAPNSTRSEPQVSGDGQFAARLSFPSLDAFEPFFERFLAMDCASGGMETSLPHPLSRCPDFTHVLSVDVELERPSFIPENSDFMHVSGSDELVKRTDSTGCEWGEYVVSEHDPSTASNLALVDSQTAAQQPTVSSLPPRSMSDLPVFPDFASDVAPAHLPTSETLSPSPSQHETWRSITLTRSQM
ncbi:hypothetical protein R3P38DRAFT_3255050 [Favolaschia claudopus]|uniref:Uncharacterized protein n=1 Tax=Favolaschia claudopus TaxID=2862362 RepID=A0AAW0DJW7_9AGAR